MRTGTPQKKCASGLRMLVWRSSLLMSATPASVCEDISNDVAKRSLVRSCMRLLVTGANGFIGRHLVEKLSHDHEIFALVRGRHHAVTNERVSVIKADLGRELDLGRLPAKIDAI